MPVYHYEINEFNLRLDIPSGIMCPSAFSIFLAKSLRNCNYQTALDVGCGSGILSIVLAKLGVPQVYSVDIDRKCIVVTRENAELNGVESQIIAQEGSLFEPVANKRFDFVVSNPPTMPTCSSVPHHCNGGRNGHTFLDTLIQQSPKHLNPAGMLQVVLSSLADLDRTEAMARKKGLRVEKESCGAIEFRPFYFPLFKRIVEESRRGSSYYLERDDSFFEELFIVRATLQKDP